MTDLLAQLVLADVRLLKLSAQLHRALDRDRELSTKVEFKLTPLQPAAGDGAALLSVHARLSCIGSYGGTAATEQVFAAELLQQLNYRQVLGPKLKFEQFSAQHMRLSRQIYPLLIQRVQPLLSELTLSQVRLPIDMLQVKSSVAESPEQLH